MAETSNVQQLKELLGIPNDDLSRNSKLLFVLNYAEYAVKNYCRIENIPVELESVVIMIAGDLFSSCGISGIKSVKEGDVRFEFDQNAFDENSILKDYHNQLEIFRKPGW